MYICIYVYMYVGVYMCVSRVYDGVFFLFTFFTLFSLVYMHIGHVKIVL